MAYDLGDTARLRLEVRDDTGALAAAGDVALTITLPDGATTSPVVSTPATGVYTASYLTVQTGRHTVRWVATGANTTSETDILDVRPADRGWLISLADARATLNLNSTADDAEVRDYLGAVTGLVERHTGQAWVQRPRRQTVTGGRRTIVAAWSPVHEITAMVPLLDVGAATYTPAELVCDEAGVLQLRSGGYFQPGQYVLTYVAGDNTAVPENVALAARIILEHLWKTQRAEALPGLSGGGGGDDFPFAVPAGFAIPNRAAQLLGAADGGIA